MEGYEKHKYNFHTIRKGEDLPDDCNAIVDDLAKKYGNKKLVSELERIRKRKRFGELEYWSPNMRLCLGRFEIADGVCKRFQLAMYDGKPYAGTWKSDDCHAVFHETRLNYMVDIRKPKDGTD